MKINEILLNEIDQSERIDEIVNWLCHNCTHYNASPLENFEQFQNIIRNKIVLRGNSGEILDLGETVWLSFNKKLESPPPFKFGTLRYFMFDPAKCDVSQFDFQYLQAVYVFIQSDKLHKSKIFELDSIVKPFAKAKNIGSIVTEKVMFNNLIAGIHMIMSDKNIGDSQIIMRELIFEVKKDGIRVHNFMHADPTKKGVRITPEILQFANVMDFQEWLFDNGYENIL